jgi:tagatose-1,6-bisphosphate aldolase
MCPAPLSIGKIRSLQQCSSGYGTFTCLALDHRQNLRRALNPEQPSSVSDADLTRFKLEVTGALANLATAVLLDPEYSAAQAVAEGVLPGGTGLVVALESTGYSGAPTARESRILPGWSPALTRRMGASMAKLLVYYHPEASTASAVESLVGQVAEQCRAQDLGLMLETLSYSIEPDRKLSSEEKRRVVIETARRLTPLGVDLLKTEFPLDSREDPDEANWLEACQELSEGCRGPWILLSAAVDFETYLRQAAVACQAGASGVAVGRAVWQEAVEQNSAARAKFLKEVARPRLQQLASLCEDIARPWTEFYTRAEIPTAWFKAYGGAG